VKDFICGIEEVLVIDRPFSVRIRNDDLRWSNLSEMTKDAKALVWGERMAYPLEIEKNYVVLSPL
jgi:hypothetical protein